MKVPATPINRARGDRAFHSLVVLLARVLLLISALHAMHAVMSAQSSGVEARVAGVRGGALITRSARPATTIAPGLVLLPGDKVDTRTGGRVTIELSDGSLVTVQPGSEVVLQDYRSATSLRELLQIAFGRVRVHINHFAGRPNPYRVNSPTASIAVRGTEFSVAVEARGDTEVVVYEGLVEVASLANPRHPVMVAPGHGVIVRPNEDIRFFVPGPGNEIGSRSHGKGESVDDSDDGTPAEAPTGPDKNARQTAAGSYERYFDNIVESGETPLPSLFAAFPDSYFDSIDNPAYATEFTTTEGRVFFLPSMGGTKEREDARGILGVGNSQLVDYSLSPQASFFVPIAKYKSVLGGRLAVSRDGLKSFTVDDNIGLTGPLFSPGLVGRRTVDGSTKNGLVAASFIAARRFGSDGRTSLGIGLDYLETNGSLFNTTVQTDANGFTARELVDTRSFVHRTRVTLGLTRQFQRGAKLAVFYRYGLLSATDRDVSRILNGQPRLLNRTTASGNSTEIGFRLRGFINHALFYGIESSYFFADSSGRTRRARVVDSNTFGDTSRATLGFGLGYAIKPRTVLSLDVTAGSARVSDTRSERLTGNLLEDERKKAYFLSLHGAVQADVWRRLFVSGSVLSVTQSEVTDLTLHPDRFGRLVTSDGLFQANGRTRDRFTDYFSNLGTGWRFTPNFLAEYIFSTDFGQTSPRHTLLLRYTFGRSEDGSSK